MRKIQFRLFCGVIALILVGSLPTRAQVATGTPAFGSFGGGPDIVNLGNLNVHLGIPVVNRDGRQLAFGYTLTYDTSVFYPVTSGSTKTWQPVNYWGWGVQTAVTTGFVSYYDLTTDCYTSGSITGTQNVYSQWTFTDQFGVTHPFAGSSEFQTGTCGNTATGMNALATDNSGYTLQTTDGNESIMVISRGGKVINPPALSKTGAGIVTDRNGNQITVSTSGVYTDTLGQTALSVSQGAPSPSTPTTFTYLAPSGANASFTMKYADFTVLTNFGCSGVGEYSATSVALVTELDLPDVAVNPQDKYTFAYEATPGHTGDVTGRLASVTLPTGGTITYAYTGSNNGIECTDGSTAGLNRTTPDGEWKYTRSGSGTAWSTTITYPSSSSTEAILDFQTVTPSGGGPVAFYETERQIYQSNFGAPLKSISTCYNGTTTHCNSTAIVQPITQRSVFVNWPSTGNLESEVTTSYDKYGDMVGKEEYAYGAGAPGALVRYTDIVYGTLGLIVDKPTLIAVEDGLENYKSQTSYIYDGVGVTTTSGTPQHVGVSGARGNLTNAYYTVKFNTGGYALNKTYTYFDTGNINTATDVNSAVMTYNYSSSSCGNSFATSISEPMSLSRSMTWNCTGAVQTSVTDENGQPATTTYSDAYFWRPKSVKDAASNVADFTYDGSTSIEGYVNFNGSTSTTDALKTVDVLGRTHVSQIKESQSSTTYDSVETDYDSDGWPSRTTLPYAATAGATNSSAPATTTTYDALGRKLTVTDSAGKTVTYSYDQNDVYRTVSPAPSGENTKRKQFEYDALGRLTSVCEITSAAGSGTCGQTNAVTGYWTQYTYDQLNNLIGVTQNAQSGSKQTRTFAYDGLSRLTSQTTPEGGTVSYAYDTLPSPCYESGTSYSGDVTERINADGKIDCYYYDARHRATSIGYEGPTCWRYYYDSATVNSIAMATAKGRLAETSTDNCVSPYTKITDLGLSYSVLGQVSDTYESTTNSGGYYHTHETYWPNGAPNQLSGPGLPTFTYGVDGEGRIYSVSASSGQNPLTSAGYSTASLPTQLDLGSVDNDAYTYDVNSNRLTQYQFNVNGESVIGKLTWNPIGTLESLVVTDALYSGGNQSCSYTHDDMSRVASANCGSPWSQTFSYDAFGNISKSGTISFQPTYSYLTNRMTQIGSSTPTYDANGNVLNDTAHTYLWDVNGRPTTIDGVTVTYDGLGRMAERDASGVYTQIVYSPDGGKLAIMKGQTLQKGFVHLAGGSVAVYNSSGLAYYRHSDWLESSRFASTPTRMLYYDGAYAPFGENYAQTGTTDLSFTGMNQDTVANLFDFPAREYNAIHGRWPSPDPAGLSSVHLGDPQTFNRYAYVRNSPLRFTDSTGMHLDDCDDTCGGDDGGGGGGGGDGGGGGGGVDDGGADGGGSNNGGSCESDSACAPPDQGPGIPVSGDNPCTGNPGLCDQPDPCLNPYSGQCGSASGAFLSIQAGNGADSTGDPCAYLNDSGTSVESTDSSSSPEECKHTGGIWYPDGGGISLSPDGTKITVYVPISLTQAAVWYLCGNSPSGAVLNWMEAGVTKGAAGGAWAGFAGGELAGGLGGIPGAALGGFTGAVVGAAGGALGGSMAAAVCYASGVYH
jgi:RHS repeat-associated protein